MTDLLLASVALALSAAALAACARVLLRPLAAVLLDLCGEAHRAEFWTWMVATCMVAGTVVSALMGVIAAPAHPALAAAALLRWVLLGLATGLAVIVAVVATFTLRRRPPPALGAGRPPT
jgi:hypothetical protein